MNFRTWLSKNKLKSSDKMVGDLRVLADTSTFRYISRIGFNSDDKNQTKLTSFEYKPVNNNHGMFNERKIRAKETRKRSKRKSSHCAKCGMQGKNVLTCLSVRLEDGTCESQHHRRTQHDKRSYNNDLL